jgi:cytochrome bd-type quinol oxidase subunit 2
MTEPDVVITDYVLAAECALFAGLLCFRNTPVSYARRCFAALFASLGLAAFLGGTVHGFFADEAARGARILWSATLLSVGAATLAAWLSGAAVLLSRRAARYLGRAALAQFIIYGSLIAAGLRDFAFAVLNYLPAVVFLLVVFAVIFARQRDRSVLFGVLGIVLTFVAALVQQMKVALHPVYFDHNALYHAIQGVALYLIFRSVPALVASVGDPERSGDAERRSVRS